jgi:hypothetical protein
MKSNSTYTALEILKATGAEKFTVDEKEYTAEEVFGKASVMIGGIRGIVAGEKIINIPTETESLDIMVGVSTFSIAIEKNDGDKEHSEAVQAVRDASVPQE